ncbi:mannose-1-phosphate guanylyltransferase [Christiangramia fulva]|uniref:mannose-1-phosphate guanylyltransferase n=1 Tax=Christiangramia fulva TaxID=2126553 RepID=A0A2R3Z1Q6_9FLAO|nr:mannose-1-phosphate guanylyltransferase [Christiangramia fulva]AVR44189.1 mannose-1-phosphate guanylyltransferase [Christiangramia fulva]
MTGTNKDNYYAILMAGGIGSRFWPSSKASNPKQFLDILGVGETLFQTTYNRLSGLIPHENIYILTNEKYVDKVKEQLPSVKDEQIVPEPEMRNTAPSILLGAMKIHKKNENALMIVAPSDHWIDNEDEFIASVQKGFDFAEQNEGLVTLGVEPAFPNTGYGYIKYDKEGEDELRKVRAFTEKPSLKKAAEFIKAGNYSWNAGIFIWSSSYIIESFKTLMPGMFQLFEKGTESLNTADEKEFLQKNYKLADTISIDYAILEKSEKVFVIPVHFKWSDLGTWSAIQKELPLDENGNTAINARVVAQDSKDNIISSSSKKVVALRKISEMIIIEDDEILMIIPKSEEQEIKKLREEVMEKFGKDLG